MSTDLYDLYFDQIQKLKTLTSVQDWDDHGAPPIPKKTWSHISNIVNELHRLHGDCHITPRADGSVQLYWPQARGGPREEIFWSK